MELRKLQLGFLQLGVKLGHHQHAATATTQPPNPPGKADANATVPAWSRVHQLERNPTAGMRAVVFAPEPGGDAGKVVVAFRGTDLNLSGISGQPG